MFGCLVSAGPAIADSVEACDRHAAHEDDPDKHGPGVPFLGIRPAPAIEACLTAAKENPDNARVVFQLGRAYDRAGNWDEAFRHYETALDMGYAQAAYNIGMNRLRTFTSKIFDDTLVPDLELAIRMFERGASLGDQYSALMQARAIRAGWYIYPKNSAEGPDTLYGNFAKAVQILETLVSDQFAPAFPELAVVYDHGIAVLKEKEDKKKMCELYIRGATQGDFTSQYRLGKLVAGGECKKETDKTSEDWFQVAVENVGPAAEAGDAFAQANYGTLWLTGHGVERDYDQAFFWLREASYQFDEYAIEFLWKRYSEALVFLNYQDGSDQDASEEELYDETFGRTIEEALDWFEWGVQHDIPEALTLVGNLYWHGTILSTDKERGKAYLTRASDLGYEPAADSLRLNGGGIQ